MEGCPNCDRDASYMCTSCKTFLWKKPKIEMEILSNEENIVKEMPTELEIKDIFKVIKNMTLKIQITDKCIREIISTTQMLTAKIEGMCMKAIKTMKEKKKHYSNIIKISKNKLISHERDKIERELQISTSNSFPALDFKDIDTFYQYNFLKEMINISQLDFMKVDQAKYILEEEYRLFVEGHVHEVNCLAITSDKKYLISGGQVGEIIIWNIKKQLQKGVLRGPTNSVIALAITSDNIYIASGSTDGTIRIWSLKEKILKSVLDCHSRRLTSLVISSNNKYIIAFPKGKSIRIWDFKSKALEFSLDIDECSINAIAITNDDKYIIMGGEKISVWNLQQQKKKFDLDTYSYARTLALAITRNSKSIISGDWSGDVIVWSFEKKEEKATFKGHVREVLNIAITSDDNFAISSGRDNTVRIWNIKEERQVFLLRICDLMCMTSTNDGRYIIFCSSDMIPRLFNVLENKEECAMPGHTWSVRRLAKSSNDKYIASAADDGTIIFWDIENKKQEAILGNHFKVKTLAIAFNDKYVISGCDEGTVQVWNVKKFTRISIDRLS